MKSQHRYFWLLFLFLAVGGAVIQVWERAGEARVERRSLKDFPSEFGAWRQRGADVRFDAATEAVLHADDYTLRDYASAGGHVGSLYIGYYDTQRGGETYHSPLNCLPGSGWQLNEPSIVQIAPADGAHTFEANRYIMANQGAKYVLVYWYQGRGRAVASEYWDKVYTVLDSVRRRRSDGAMVRVLVPVTGTEDEAVKAATELAAQSAPHLDGFVPD
ncbi:MAG TPA: EpsI family protein [Pyrinomonadaceae bacterium]|jgi:EpsI family protein